MRGVEITKHFMAVVCLLFFNYGLAEDYAGCVKRKNYNYDKGGKQYQTPLGLLEQYTCLTDDGLMSDQPQYLVLAGKKIFTEINFSGSDINVARSIFLYGGGSIRDSLIGGVPEHNISLIFEERSRR